MSKYKLIVEVRPQFLAQQSSVPDSVYAFSYTVTITNAGSVAIQIISRTWHINDATGYYEKVKGLGIVGYQPLIKPSESFQYTSGARLKTPTGTMHGNYFCVAEDGEKYDVDIPMFVLDALSDEERRPNLH